MKQPKTIRELIAVTLGKKVNDLSNEDIERGLNMELWINTNFDGNLTKKERSKVCSNYASKGEVIAGLFISNNIN